MAPPTLSSMFSTSPSTNTIQSSAIIKFNLDTVTALTAPTITNLLDELSHSFENVTLLLYESRVLLSVIITYYDHACS